MRISNRELQAQDFVFPASLCVSIFPCISWVVVGFETPTPHFPVVICGAIACVQGHLHYRGGLSTRECAEIRPGRLEISSMSSLFACAFRGRKSNCSVFSTPPVRPNAFQLTPLGQNPQYGGGGGYGRGLLDQRGDLGGAYGAPCSSWEGRALAVVYPPF